MVELASANIPIKTTQKHAAPPVIPNSLSCQCGSKGAERLGRFKWGPGQYNCQQRGLRGALQLLCSLSAEKIGRLCLHPIRCAVSYHRDNAPAKGVVAAGACLRRLLRRFLRQKKAHPLTTGLLVVSLQATSHSEAIKNLYPKLGHCLAKEGRAAAWLQASPSKTKTRDCSRASVWVDWFFFGMLRKQLQHICPYGANISYAQRISYTATRYIS